MQYYSAGQFNRVAHLHFLENACAMGLDCALRYTEFGRDDFIGLAYGNQMHDIALARGELSKKRLNCMSGVNHLYASSFVCAGHSCTGLPPCRLSVLTAKKPSWTVAPQGGQ